MHWILRKRGVGHQNITNPYNSSEKGLKFKKKKRTSSNYYGMFPSQSENPLCKVLAIKVGSTALWRICEAFSLFIFLINILINLWRYWQGELNRRLPRRLAIPLLLAPLLGAQLSSSLIPALCPGTIPVIESDLAYGLNELNPDF